MDESAALAEQLRAAVGRLVRITTRADTLPPGEGAVLGTLDRDGPQTIAQLAQERGVRHQTVAKMVAQLDTAGLVSKRVHPADARMVRVALTRKGRAALARDRAARATWLAGAIRSQLTPAQRRQLPGLVAVLDALSRYPGAEPGAR